MDTPLLESNGLGSDNDNNDNDNNNNELTLMSRTDEVEALPPGAEQQQQQQHNQRQRPQGLSTNRRVGRGRQLLHLLSSPLIEEEGSPNAIIYGLCTLFIIGTILGLVFPTSQNLPTLWYSYVSNIIGYIYFTCWSISFYPQVISNYRRQSTVGLSSDFVSLNILGFACYATYNCSLFFNKHIQELYKKQHGGKEITVQSNDVAFALHALLLSSITLGQIIYYNWKNINTGTTTSQQQHHKPSKVIISVMAIIIFIIIIGILLASKSYKPGPSDDSGGSGGGGGKHWGSRFGWLDFLYMLSYIKVFISLIKYVPQAILNFRRKSTIGWSIWNIILDFTGGILSDLQLVFDCIDLGDFSGITGNVAKFMLGFVSITFDIIFMAQHYILYRDNNNRRNNRQEGQGTSFSRPLIPSMEPIGGQHDGDGSEEEEESKTDIEPHIVRV